MIIPMRKEEKPGYFILFQDFCWPCLSRLMMESQESGKYFLSAYLWAPDSLTISKKQKTGCSDIIQ